MPNIAPNGVWGRGQGTSGLPTPMIEGVATLPGETTARQVIEVWVGRPDGTPVIVWSLTAGSPASATASYTPTAVTVSWVPSTPLIADSYNVRRPDGSLVANVPPGATSFVDESPLPLSGPYRVFGVLAGVQSSFGTPTNTLDLRLQPASVTADVINGGATDQSVTLSWTQPTLGRPDGWQVFRDGSLVSAHAGTVTSISGVYAPAGANVTYQVRAVLSGAVSALPATVTVGVPPLPPTNVTLTATTDPLSNLRLTWAHAAGGRTGYEIDTWAAPSGPWTSNGPAGPNETVRDWPTEVAGHMRIRSVADGIGVSQWVYAGPTSPINDITPPADATITSYTPEASYGRVVLRFNTPSADFYQYAVQRRINGGAIETIVGWTSTGPSTAVAQVIGSYTAGTVVEARVLVRDLALNQRTGPWQTYTLTASPVVIDAVDSGTWRDGELRNDGIRAINEIATGWTGSGHNIGCWYYGNRFVEQLAALSLISGTIEYWRENEGGQSSAVQPLMWGIANPDKSVAPTLTDQGMPESNRLGTGVRRSGSPTSGYWSIPATFLGAMRTGAVRGFAAYRGYAGSGDPDNYYALLSIAGVPGGNPGRVNGRVIVYHLG